MQVKLILTYRKFINKKKENGKKTERRREMKLLENVKEKEIATIINCI